MNEPPTLAFPEGDPDPERSLRPDLEEPTRAASIGSWSVPGVEGSAAAWEKLSEAERTIGAAGRFSLRERIGAGGLGEVWEGVQHSLSRVVAVKRLREDHRLDTESDPEKSRAYRQLFHQEALTTAQLDHPNIVPVYDLGIDAQGQPLIAMKLVRGIPWRKAIAADRRALPQAEYLTKHLGILLQVAQAIAFAHSRGIVHRDLKPSQVIVGEFGEVMLADWGLALFHDRSLAEAHCGGALPDFLPTRATASCPAGTPAYMAPEQTEADARNIGPWTDLYLLGGCLYHILVGTAPHPADSRTLAVVQAKSGVIGPLSSAPNLPWPIPEELDALARRALDPEPIRRVASARDFIQAIQDYLSGSSRRRQSQGLTDELRAAVLERPGSYAAWGDALAKAEQARVLWPENPELPALLTEGQRAHAELALRNGDLVLARVSAERIGDGTVRAAAVERVAEAEQQARNARRLRRAAIAAAACLAVGIAGTVYVYNAQLRCARDASEAARASAEENRAAAQRARSQAEGLVTFMLKDLRETLAPVDRLDPLRHIANRVAEFYDANPAPPDSEFGPVAIRNRAIALEYVADVEIAQGNTQRGLEMIDRALGLYRELAGFAAEARSAQLGQAWLHRYRAQILRSRERRSEAKESLDTAEAILAGMTPDAPGARLLGVLVQFERAMMAQDLGEMDRAEELYGAIIAALLPIAEEERDAEQAKRNLVRVYERRGTLYLSRGELEAAQEDFTRSYRLAEEQLAAQPDSVEALRHLAMASGNLADGTIKHGRLEEALEWDRKSLEAYVELSKSDRSNVERQFDLAQAQGQRAMLLSSMGRYEEALEVARASLATHEAVYRKNPGDEGYGRGYAISLSRVGNVLEYADRFEEAIPYYDTALVTRQALFAAFPESVMVARDMLRAETYQCRMLRKRERFDEAIPHIERAIEIGEGLMNSGRGNEFARNELHAAYMEFANVLRDLGDREGQFEQYEKILAGTEESARNPDGMMQEHKVVRAVCLMYLGRIEEAAPLCRELVAGGYAHAEFLDMIDHFGVPMEDTPGGS